MILLFDEANAFSNQWTDTGDDYDCFANIEEPYLYQRLESLHEFVVLATNLSCT